MIRLLLRFPWLAGLFALVTLTLGALLWQEHLRTVYLGTWEHHWVDDVLVRCPLFLGLGVVAYFLCRRKFLASERRRKGAY